MSWVVEEWKDGLPTRTLQKIQELEGQLDKLKKERQQRQLQLESLEAAFQKQKQKVESEKSEISALKRENQSLRELCDSQEKTRQKMGHDQQVKDTHISIVEGQLSASKKHIDKLEQELKRYKNDLERSQQSFSAADMSVCVTPQRCFTAASTPAKIHGPEYEELQEQYNKEVTERKKLETELKILQMKLVNQTSQPAPPNPMTHRDIARHQSSSSVFSWTPSSHDNSLKRSHASIQYPWEQEETPSKKGLKSEGLNRSACESSNSRANDQLRSQNQELRSQVSELELRLQVQERELKNQQHKVQETQTERNKMAAELSERDRTLTKSAEDLARVTLQLEQAVDKCTSAEQRLKKVSEELSCQRLNGESALRSLEQRLKEQEKESQQELSRLQRSLQETEQQLNQVKSQLNQKSQQAKNQFNAVQADLERATHGKKILEQEIEDLKQKLSRAEDDATARQKQWTDLKRDLEDARSQQNVVRSHLEYKTKENLKLEEELRTANQSLRQNQVFIEELKNTNTSFEAEIMAAVKKRDNQDSMSLENLKVLASHLEKERDFTKELLQTSEKDLAKKKMSQYKMSEEMSSLRNLLHCKEQENKEMIEWKNQHENKAAILISEKEEISRKLKDSEEIVQNLSDQITLLENDKKNVHTQIRSLQDILDVRSADLELQKEKCANLDHQMVMEIQKYQKERENLLQQISELEAQWKNHEINVCSDPQNNMENELDEQKKLNAELQGQIDKLLRDQQEIRAKCVGRLSNPTNLQDALSEPFGDFITSVIREKEEEICVLSEKLSSGKTEMESAYEEMTAKLQESWSAEREALSASVRSLQSDMEEIRRMGEKTRTEKMDTSQRNLSQSLEGDQLIVESKEENTSSSKSLKEEMAEWKEKVSRIQHENSRLLRHNEELSAVVGKLRDSELSLNKALEELRACLKDKEASLRNAQMELELVNKRRAEIVESVPEQLIDFQSPPNQRKNVPPEIEAPERQKERRTILQSPEETLMVGTSDGTLIENSLLDITEDISLFAPLTGPQNREENLTLLINMDQLTLASAKDPTLPLPDLTLFESTKPSTFSSPPVKERVNVNRERKSVTSAIVDLLLESPQQAVTVPGEKSEEPETVNDLLLVYQMELSRLHKQHLSDISTWQQRLKDQATEMETKLTAEKAESERLAQELEAARLELQVFDLSARSLLSFDNDDFTTRLDAANQTLCTVLPIGRLSLSSNDLQTSAHLCQSPRLEKKSLDENTAEKVHHGSPKELEDNIEKSSWERKRRKWRSGEHGEKLEPQDVSENVHLKAEEQHKICRLLKEREGLNQSLLAEIKDLSVHIETLKAELLDKDMVRQDLENKFKDFEVEKLKLLEEMEMISSEKLQSANKIVELEEELKNSLNAVEMLKQETSELSSIRESLESSSKEWKESYLQSESELRRAKSEKANIEQHALSLEADLDAIHARCQSLQEESEGNLRSFNEIQEKLNSIVEEKCQLNQELESLSEEKEELEQMYKKLKGREDELEASKASSKELIKILEAELRTLKEELQAAKLTAEELTAERDCIVRLQGSEKAQVQELQNQIEKILEEKKVLVNEQEDLQIQINTMQTENEKLSRALERSQHEKHELGSSLSSAQEEVTLMRTGIEKLKVKIEADEKKKHHSIEKIKESERKFDKLNDKIESLERELLMSEENLESSILQAEALKEELEGVKEQKEALEIELKCLKEKLEELEEELQKSWEKMAELEATVVAITRTLEDKEIEHNQFMDHSKKQQDLLQVEIAELLSQKDLSDQRYEGAVAECAEISSKMEQQKEQLLQDLEKAQMASKDLEMSLQKLTLEQEELKLQLQEKTRQLEALERQSKDTEQREVTYSTEIARYEVHCENLKSKNESLQNTLEELEQRVQTITADNEHLKTSRSDLEALLESTRSEKQTLQNKVTDLEDKLQDADLHMMSLKEQKERERRDLEEEMQNLRRRHQDSTDEDAARFQERVASLEAHLHTHTQEIERLRAGNEDLAKSLCKAQEQLTAMTQLEVTIDDLKKEKAQSGHDLQRWMTSCEELQEEKQQLQQRVHDQEEALKSLTHTPDDMKISDDRFLSEIEELKQILEEKTLEADESVEKYCNLMIKTHKLEDTNETLRMQVDVLNSRLRELEETPTCPPKEAPEEDKKKRKSRRSTQQKQAAKRRRDSEHNPPTPRAVTKKVKKSQDLEEEIEPEGLPEVVRKGFADIPSGKQSPFILRRTAAPLRRSPRVLSQTNSPSVLNTHIDNVENLPDLKSPTAGRSTYQGTKAPEEHPAPSDLLSPLSAHVKMKSRPVDNPCADRPERASARASHDDTEEERTCHVQ